MSHYLSCCCHRALALILKVPPGSQAGRPNLRLLRVSLLAILVKKMYPLQAW